MLHNAKCTVRPWGLGVVSLFLVLLVGSCYPEFVNPIPAPRDLKFDRAILGNWIRTADDGMEQLSVFPRKSGWVDIVYIYGIDSTSSTDGVNLLMFEGYSVMVGSDMFLCYRQRMRDFPIESPEKAEPVPFWVVNYECLKGGRLVVRHFSNEKVGALVEKGILEGKTSKEDVSRGRYYDQVKVTSSSEKLVKLIREKGASALVDDKKSERMVFSRRKD